MKLFNERSEEASLKDICKWIVETYPDDVFICESKHPVNIMRNKAYDVLVLLKKGNRL